MGYIVFEGRKCKKITFNIATDAPFHEILKKVNNICIPEENGNEEEILYAILELINNSLRAHRQQNIRESVRTDINISNGQLHVAISDKGAGFDVDTLPYSMDTPVHEIDTNSSSFQAYREKHRYKQFGMGLLIARRQFPQFRIIFLDSTGKGIPYTPGIVSGTRIEMSKRLNNG